MSCPCARGANGFYGIQMARQIAALEQFWLIAEELGADESVW